MGRGAWAKGHGLGAMGRGPWAGRLGPGAVGQGPLAGGHVPGALGRGPWAGGRGPGAMGPPGFLKINGNVDLIFNVLGFRGELRACNVSVAALG